MARQRTIGNTQFFKPNWADNSETMRFVEQELLKGTVLNFPCGTSQLGDVRADIDGSVNPDILADIQNNPFEDGSFDTVYCDPPYSMHAFDKVRWALDLWDVARERLILQTTTEKYEFKNATRKVWIADRRGLSRCFQILQVFDRADHSLHEY